ncbi:hypothetical protein PYCC9005_000037 [Savitreella phatthalungensis]
MGRRVPLHRQNTSKISRSNAPLFTKSKEDRIDPLRGLFGLSTANGFALAAFTWLLLYDWAFWWFISGTPVLTYTLLLGASRGVRVLPALPLWSILLMIYAIYSVCVTSWLLFRVYSVLLYILLFIAALFQFGNFASAIRRILRRVLRELQFVNDQIALFDIPALEIDTEVDGLMVVRGLTLSLTRLTIIVHEVEVAVKLSDDLELALSVEKVTVKLFRSVSVGAVFGNLKGGEHEMTFGRLHESTKDEEGNALMHTDSSILQTARAGVERFDSRSSMVTMTAHMTNGHSFTDSSLRTAAHSVHTLSPDDSHAREQYLSTIRWIEESSAIMKARKLVERLDRSDHGHHKLEHGEDGTESVELKAAICTALHAKASIAHPPSRSIRVTTLQTLLPRKVREILHRCPMLLRLLVNPLAYFHPVHIESITVAASGKWVQSVLDSELFKDYTSNDLTLRRLYRNISQWIDDANFVVHLGQFEGVAQVPFITTYDIICQLLINDLIVFRTLPKQLDLNQVVRLGGADAQFFIPYHLMPHHEHIIPDPPSVEAQISLQREIDEADDGKPKRIQRERELRQIEKDESNVSMSVHAKLPVVLDQELLNFIMALVKATQVIEVVKAPGIADKEVHGLRDIADGLGQSMTNGMKKMAIEGLMNDQWIAKMVGKITRKLEKSHGDIGYTGDIPVQLKDYRPTKPEREPSKLLP